MRTIRKSFLRHCLSLLAAGSVSLTMSAHAKVLSVETVSLGYNAAYSLVGTSNGVVFKHQNHLNRVTTSSSTAQKLTSGGSWGPGVTAIHKGDANNVLAGLGNTSNAVLTSVNGVSGSSPYLADFSSLKNMKDTVQIGYNVFVLNNPTYNASTNQISMADMRTGNFSKIPADIETSSISPVTVVGVNGYQSQSQVSLLRVGNRLAVFTRASADDRANRLDHLTTDANGSATNDYTVHLLSSSGKRVRSITGLGSSPTALVAGSTLVIYNASSAQSVKLITSAGNLVNVSTPLQQAGVYRIKSAHYAQQRIFLVAYANSKHSVFSMNLSGLGFRRLSDLPKEVPFGGAIALTSVDSNLYIKYRPSGSEKLLKVNMWTLGGVTDITNKVFPGGTKNIYNLTAAGSYLFMLVVGKDYSRQVIGFNTKTSKADTIVAHRSLYGYEIMTSLQSRGLHFTPVGSGSIFFSGIKSGGGYGLTRVKFNKY